MAEIHGEQGATFIDDGTPAPAADERVRRVIALVAVHPDGGEGVYGRSVPGLGRLVPVFATSTRAKRTWERTLRRAGDYEMAARKGVRLEWREFSCG